jgi:hypothetical protein
MGCGFMIVSSAVCAIVGRTIGWWIAALLAAYYGFWRGWRYVYWCRVDFFAKWFFEEPPFGAAALDDSQKAQKAYGLAVEAVNRELRGR